MNVQESSRASSDLKAKVGPMDPEPDLIYPKGRRSGVLTLIFDVQIHKKYGLLKPEVENLEVFRNSAPRLKDLTDHLKSHVTTLNGDCDKLLLKAVCTKSRSSFRNSHLQNGCHSLSNGKSSHLSGSVSTSSHTHSSHTSSSSSSSSSRWLQKGVVPLVCPQIWGNILQEYPEARLKILVNQHLPEVRVDPNTSCIFPRLPTLNRELKYVDVAHFLPSKRLRADHVMKLCRDIFEGGVRVKPELRRGVWLHLVGVFHPGLQSREERERYMGKLRMAYDHLKGKIMGDDLDSSHRDQLVDAVYRDAIRTDPNHPFFADHRLQEASYISQHYHQAEEENNIQKLINITAIYTLEHSDISYTQGMTDLLSPILYVMRNEADAYVCFAAMVERIRQHFGQWCTGTLHKLERLRHICEVLDPPLYRCLTSNIEEDAFVLFFGMVLIECRREFSFKDSFHLLETVWAGAACIGGALPTSSDKSHAEWARFMTDESPEVLEQVFEGTGVPYSAVPLRHTISGSYSTTGAYYPYSRNPSLLSQSPSAPISAAAAFLRRQSELEATTGGIPEVTTDSSGNGDSSPPPTPLGINRAADDDPPPCLPGRQGLRPHERVLGHDEVVIEGEQGGTEATRTSDTPRLRSHSDSNLRSLSSMNSLAATDKTPPTLKGSHVSPQREGGVAGGGGGGGGVEVGHFSKLGSNSFSHSESELYDSFANSKIMMIKPKLGGRNPTEMSDMSSLSSGTASGNLLSSLRSTDSRKGGGARNFTPDSACSGEGRGHRQQGRRQRTQSGSASQRLSTSSSEGEGGGAGSAGGRGSASRESPASRSTTSSEFKDAVDYQPLPDDHQPRPSDDHQPCPSDVAVGADLPSEEAKGAVLVAPIVTRSVPTPTDDTDTAAAREDGGHVTSTDQVDSGGGISETDLLTQLQPGLLEVEPEYEREGVTVEQGGRITSTTNGYRSPLVPHRDRASNHASSSNHTSTRSTPHPPALPGSGGGAGNNRYPHSDGDVIHHSYRTTSPKNIYQHRRAGTPPTSRSNASTPVHYGSSGHRVTPVAFFDTMEKLAESMSVKGSLFPPHFLSKRRGNTERETDRKGEGNTAAEGEGSRRSEEEEEGEGEGMEEAGGHVSSTYLQARRQRAGSDVDNISHILSQLVSTEEGAPRVDRRDSLSIPVSDCYSLFVCLSILVQSRDDIIASGADFYHLSTVLNTQAASQNLEKTLRVARQLYSVYRHYQEMWFGKTRGLPVEEYCDMWLDDTSGGPGPGGKGRGRGRGAQWGTES